MAPRASLLATTQTVLSSYPPLTPAVLLAPLHETCTIRMLPSTLSTPLWTKSEYALQVAKLCSIFKSFTATMLEEPVVDEVANRVTAYVRMEAETVAGWKYVCEGVWMLKMVDGGEEVVEVREFVDSRVQAEFLEEIGRMVRAKQQAGVEKSGEVEVGVNGVGKENGEMHGDDGVGEENGEAKLNAAEGEMPKEKGKNEGNETLTGVQMTLNAKRGDLSTNNDELKDGEQDDR